MILKFLYLLRKFLKSKSSYSVLLRTVFISKSCYSLVKFGNLVTRLREKITKLKKKCPSIHSDLMCYSVTLIIYVDQGCTTFLEKGAKKRKSSQKKKKDDVESHSSA